MLNDLLNQFHTGDSLEFLRAMPSKSVHCVVTSPPYNLRESENGIPKNLGHGLPRNKKVNDFLNTGYGVHNDCMPHKKYVAWQREVLTECMRVIRDDGAIFYNHKPRIQKGALDNRWDIVGGLPLPVRQEIIWIRDGGANFTDSHFLTTTERIYFFAGKKFKIDNSEHRLHDVWRISQEYNSPHPAPFPIELPYTALLACGGKGKIVLDPFSGSGTTAAAALKAGWHFIGIDIDPEYNKMAKARVLDKLPLEIEID